MFLETKEFVWLVERVGYRIVTAAASGEDEGNGDGGRRNFERFITAKRLTAGADEPQSFDSRYLKKYPLDIGVPLHRIFARVETSEAAILQFSNDYGLLGGDLNVGISIVDEAREGDRGESLTSWKQEIELMRDATEIYDCIQDADRERLMRFASERSERAAAYQISPTVRLIDAGKEVAADSLPDLLKKGFDKGIPFSFAKRVLMGIVNGRLENRAGFGLDYVPKTQEQALQEAATIDRLWESGEAEGRTVGQMLDVDEATMSNVGLVFAPTSLIGALWLELALALMGDKSFGTCGRCHQPFEKKGKAPHQRFCSKACKQAVYRQRKQMGLEGDIR